MQETFLGNLGLGLTTMAIGLFVVFLGLAILIGMIYVMTALTSRKKKEAEKETPVQPVQAEEAAQDTEEDENDESVIAAITAALALVMENQDQGFIVRRVRRISPPAWQQAVRDEQMRGF
ncbi:MAG: OadG family protein [Clostridia bacterium]|nr:OadG family protein [Clostridia bacterium]